MLKAIRMIKDAKQAKGLSDTSVVVDVHPSRPDYRGFGIGETIVSLEADPTFEEMEEAGATVNKSSETHTVLDDMFLISGEIPRVTSYENGLKGALRFDSEEGDWFSDEMINDERFLMCNLKGSSQHSCLNSTLLECTVHTNKWTQAKGLSCSPAAATPGSSTPRSTPKSCSKAQSRSMQSSAAST